MTVIALILSIILPVWQQPIGLPGYIWFSPNVVTQFGLSRQYGNIGLIAHDYAAGENFKSLRVGDTITIQLENENLVTYHITEEMYCIPDQNDDPYSDFTCGETRYSASDLFIEVFRANYLTLETCDGNGRRFWLAVSQ